MNIRKILTIRGFSLVEVVLSGSIFVLISTILVGAYLYGQESTILAGQRARATLIAQEGMEAIHNILAENADNPGAFTGYDQLAPGSYGLSVVDNQWKLTCTEDTTEMFRRQIDIRAVDDLRRDVTSTVVWPQNAVRNGSVSVTSRITSPVVYNVGNWSTITKQSSVNIPGNQNGRKVQVKGNYAYMIRRDGNPDFIVLDIANPTSPTIVGTLNLSGTPHNLAISGHYAYVTQDDNDAELIVINISNPAAPQVTGQYVDTVGHGATGVSVVGGRAYVTSLSQQGHLNIINISNPANLTLIRSVQLNGHAGEVVVLGDYAYIASDNNSQELEIFDVSNATDPVRVGTLNMPGNTQGLSIAAFGSTVVMGRTGNSNSLSLIDVSTPSSPVVVGNFNAQGSVNDISLANGNKYAFIATNSNSAELQVVDISNPASPTSVGGYNLTGNYPFDGVAYDPEHDRAMCVGVKQSEEFIIVKPQ